jgi:unsaturated chondroitin disaccharide hydrolase
MNRNLKTQNKGKTQNAKLKTQNCSALNEGRGLVEALDAQRPSDISTASEECTSLQQKAEAAFAFAERQIGALITSHPDYFPLFTSGGRWFHESEVWTNWCEGFLGGILWIFARRTGDTWWRAKAEHYSRLIEHRKRDRKVHDLGFLFLPTWKVWFDLTGDPAKNNVVIEAGRTLALRFNEKGKYLRSFVAADSLFIDIMMNVGIIIYAGQQSADERLVQIGLEHSLTTRRFLVRGDGSTAHEGIFDPRTGEFLRPSTHQGWRGDSAWARGQAWALFGFSSVYELSKEARFLATAESCADYYVDRTPDHGVPPNDWDEPSPSVRYESSAAAIAACGLLHLAKQATTPEKAGYYKSYARNILSTLLTSEFLASQSEGWEGVLKHGIYHLRKGLGVDESVMWGEYFFIAALDAILG